MLTASPLCCPAVTAGGAGLRSLKGIPRATLSLPLSPRGGHLASHALFKAAKTCQQNSIWNLRKAKDGSGVGIQLASMFYLQGIQPPRLLAHLQVDGCTVPSGTLNTKHWGVGWVAAAPDVWPCSSSYSYTHSDAETKATTADSAVWRL